MIDRTYKRVIFEDIEGKHHTIDALSAVYYMVSLIFNKTMKVVSCNHCQTLHLDKDWFSVHVHKKHLCAACGREFYDTSKGIGNPLMAMKQLCNDGEIFRTTVPAKKKRLDIKQADYLGGIRIWGSNQAILWTSTKMEEPGIHVRCYSDTGAILVDDTFQTVTIDGVELNPEAVRLWMTQSALPHLSNDSFVSLTCPHCKKSHCDVEELAYTPHQLHQCEHCHSEFSTRGRKKLVISNPMCELIDKLSEFAIRTPQIHRNFLRPEV